MPKVSLQRFHHSLPRKRVTKIGLIYIGNTKKVWVKLLFKDTLKAFNDFKNKQKNVWSYVFWYVKVCIFWKCVQYTIHWDKAQMLKKFPSDKINGTKMPSFFFRELQLITVLLLICDSYMSRSTRFVSLKLCMGFPIFNSVPFLLKFIFLFNKMHELLGFKTS